MSPDMLAGGAGPPGGAVGGAGSPVGQTPPGLPTANPALMLAQMMRRSGKKGKKHGRGKRK